MALFDLRQDPFDGNAITELLNRVETYTVPAAPNYPYDDAVKTRYVIELNEIPYIDSVTYNISVTGGVTYTRWTGGVFNSGEYKVLSYYEDPDNLSNLVEFNAAQAGDAVSIDYWGIGSLLTKNIITSNFAFQDIIGLTTSNGTDADHDIDISTGKCWDSTLTMLLKLDNTLTKQIDATWVEGTNSGGLFTGTVTNDATYHLFLIRKDSNGNIDAGFDTSITASNRPAGWTEYRRIASYLTDASSNLQAFTQFGNRFLIGVVELNTATPATVSTPISLSLPNIEMIYIFYYYFQASTSTNSLRNQFYITDANGERQVADIRSDDSITANRVITNSGMDSFSYLTTNTINYRVVELQGNVSSLQIRTRGYIDERRI